MTLEQMAIATRSDEAWLSNSRRLLNRRLHRTPSGARWWALVRVLSHELGLSLKSAAEAADAVLQSALAPNRIRIAAARDGSAALQLDLERFLSTANASLSAAFALGEPRRRGRPRVTRTPEPPTRTKGRGVDLTLLHELSGMLTGLADGDVSFVAVGDAACVAHGSATPALHLQICANTTLENLTRLARLLRDWDAFPRGIDRALPFIMDVNTLAAVPLLALATSHGAIDVMASLPAVGGFGEAWAGSVEIEAFGIRFGVLGLDALFATLRATGRPGDIKRVIELSAQRSFVAAG
jgi:hypothetical protein